MGATAATEHEGVDNQSVKKKRKAKAKETKNKTMLSRTIVLCSDGQREGLQNH
jgi:hypothetical protein